MLRRAPWLLLLLATGVWAQDFLRTVANTTSQNEVCVTWSNRRIVYVIDAAGSERTPAETEFSAITNSFATWQVVSDGCSDFSFSGGGWHMRAEATPGTRSRRRFAR